MGIQPELLQHLQTGLTTVAQAWAITRSDGVRYGFTDHDKDLSFEGFTFKASTGLTASAVEQGTGLSVDNAEAMGVLSDTAIRDEDIRAGRLDGAEVTTWMVNWSKPEERSVVFRGSIGELRRQGGAFVAELRGLAEQLNLPRGRVYQRPCAAVLGDSVCRVDVSAPQLSVVVGVDAAEDNRVFQIPNLPDFEPEWFMRGVLHVETGAGAGLSGLIKRDWLDASDMRHVELWEALGAQVHIGDQVRLVAGCDKRFETCRFKFQNGLNFQGFPDIPGEDWVTSYPVKDGANTGGSRR